jgi:hypothetical protein
LAGGGNKDADGRDATDRRGFLQTRGHSSWRRSTSTMCSAILSGTARGQATMSLRGKTQRLEVVLGANYRAVVIYAPKAAPGQDAAAATSSASSRRGNHQRAESRPQGRVTKSCSASLRRCLAGELLDPSRRFLGVFTDRRFVLSIRSCSPACSHAQLPRRSRSTISRVRSRASGRATTASQRESSQPARSNQHPDGCEARGEMDARDGRLARPADDADRDRRVMYVAAVNEARAPGCPTGRQIWQFVRRGRRGSCQRETRRPASIAASPCSAIACFSRPITLTCSPSID